MNAFTSKYPQFLRDVVVHAARSFELFARPKHAAVPGRGASRRIMRREKVELVFGRPVSDWPSGVRSIEDSACSLTTGLLELQAGARAQFGLQGEPDRCDDEVFPTASRGAESETFLTPPEAPRVPLSSLEPRFDPGAVLHAVYGIEPSAKNDSATSTRGEKQ